MGDLFVVVVCCHLDDFPVRVFQDEKQAKEWAEKCDHVAEMATVAKQCGLSSTSYPASIRIHKFENGVPVSCEIVRDLD